MMHRAAARTLLQRTPTHARTQATTAVKRPTSYSTPRTRTPAASPPAPSNPAAAAAAAPAPRRVLTKRVTPAPAAVPAAAVEQAPPVDASVDEAPAPTPAPPTSSSVRAQPTTSFAPVDALPAGGPIASSQTLAAAAATGGDPFGGAAAAPVVGPEVDWSTSYHGLSAVPFTREQGEVLMRPLEEHEIEIKPGALRPSPSNSQSPSGLTLLATRRRPPVPPRDPVSPDPQQGVWAGRVGHGPPGRDDGPQEPRHARVGARRRWTVR